MRGKDRCLRTLRNEDVDRVSVHPEIDYSYAAGLSNTQVSECFLNPEIHARVLESIFDIHEDIDGLYVNLCLSPNVIKEIKHEGMEIYATDTSGSVWTIPTNDVGAVTRNGIDSLSDSRLKTINPLSAGINETFGYISDDIKSRYLIVPGLTGPFSQLVFIMGFEKVLVSLIEEPNLLYQALEWRLVIALEWLDDLIALGAECVWIGEGAASSSVISPTHYKEFVYPFQKVLIDEMKRRGIHSIIHICGDVTKSMHYIAETGADALDIDHLVDLNFALDKIGDKVVVKGNINPRELKELSAPEIYELSQKKIRDSRRGRGIILSTGCLVARNTPRENIDAMVKASVDLR